MRCGPAAAERACSRTACTSWWGAWTPQLAAPHRAEHLRLKFLHALAAAAELRRRGRGVRGTTGSSYGFFTESLLSTLFTPATFMTSDSTAFFSAMSFTEPVNVTAPFFAATLALRASIESDESSSRTLRIFNVNVTSASVCAVSAG